MTVEDLNAAPADVARSLFLACCGSGAWAERMAARRPFGGLAAMEESAREVWRSLEKSDWLEAFAAHPKIGARKLTGEWAANEQSGMTQASQSTAESIRRLNIEYERRFGWIFIVCATGKTGDEMLESLAARLDNDEQREIEVAGAEQLKITELRLRKLIAQ
jgi:2-oxo-4-hydroxy-4-carboxy-5-ureidoimidazoline decarboxylase